MSVAEEDFFAKAFDVEAIAQRVALARATDGRRLLRNARAALRVGDWLFNAKWSAPRNWRGTPQSPPHAATIALFERAWRRGDPKRDVVDEVLEEISAQRFTPVSTDQPDWIVAAFADNRLAGQKVSFEQHQLEVNWSAAVMDTEAEAVFALARATFCRADGKRNVVFTMAHLDPPDEPATPDISKALFTYLQTLVKDSGPSLDEALRAPYEPGSFFHWAQHTLPRYFPPGLVIANGVRPDGVRETVSSVQIEIDEAGLRLTTEVREDHPDGTIEFTDRVFEDTLDRIFWRDPPPKAALAIEIIDRWKRAASACLSEEAAGDGFVPLLECLVDVGTNGRARTKRHARFDRNAIARFAEGCTMGTFEERGVDVAVLNLPDGKVKFYALGLIFETAGGATFCIRWEFHYAMLQSHADPWKSAQLLCGSEEIVRALGAHDTDGRPLEKWFGAMDARPVVNPRIDAGFIFRGIEGCDHNEQVIDFLLREWVNPCVLKA